VDETGERICGKRWWIHVASTDLLTLLYSHDERGSLATEDMGSSQATPGSRCTTAGRRTGTMRAPMLCAGRTSVAT